MTIDPPRLLEQSSPGLASVLVEAGREEKPAEAALRRTLLAVGASAAVLTASSAAGGAVASGAAGSAIVKSGVGSTSLGLVFKWLGIGTIGGAVTAAAAYRFAPDVSAPQAARPSVAAVVSAAPPARPAPVTRVSRERSGEIRADPVEGAEILEPAPRRAGEAVPVEKPVAVDPATPLAAEVAFVDRARTAFQAGNFAATLEALARYESRFPEQRLQAEVLFLRMEAYGGLGDRAGAETLARRILAAYPKSPHAARARGVLGERLEKE